MNESTPLYIGPTKVRIDDRGMSVNDVGHAMRTFRHRAHPFIFQSQALYPTLVHRGDVYSSNVLFSGINPLTMITPVGIARLIHYRDSNAATQSPHSRMTTDALRKVLAAWENYHMTDSDKSAESVTLELTIKDIVERANATIQQLEKDKRILTGYVAERDEHIEVLKEELAAVRLELMNAKANAKTVVQFDINSLPDQLSWLKGDLQ